MTFLDIPSLKSCRLVNKYWSDEATRQLKSRAITKIVFWPDELQHNRKTKKARFSDYLRRSFVCQNVHCVMDAEPNSSTLLLFLKKFGLQVRNLSTNSTRNLKIWLEHSPNLTSVHIHTSELDDLFPKDEPPFCQIKDLFFSFYGFSDSWSIPIANQMIHYFPNLERLSLKISDYDYDCKYIPDPLKGIALQGKNWSPNLHSLNILSNHGFGPKLILFANLGSKWRNIRIGHVLLERRDDVERFEGFLDKSKETLQELEFQLTSAACSLVLPRFSKLRKLEIQFNLHSPKIETFLYSEKFPVLEHFSYEDKSEFNRPLLQIFFPAEGQICRTIKTLSVQLHRHNVAKELPHLEKLFPMADFL